MTAPASVISYSAVAQGAHRVAQAAPSQPAAPEQPYHAPAAPLPQSQPLAVNAPQVQPVQPAAVAPAVPQLPAAHVPAAGFPAQPPLQAIPQAGFPAAPAATGTGITTLYFGDLHPDVNETTLYDILQVLQNEGGVPAVSSVRVCRDRLTRVSLGYAYVNFTSPEVAKTCLEKLNFMPIRQRPVRIMPNQRNSEMRKSGRNNVCIRGLEPNIDNKMLWYTFKQFGPILSSKVATDPEGKSRGYAFVQYETAEAAEKAIAEVHGKYLEGKKVSVTPFVPREKREVKDPEATFCNLYVKHFSPEVTDEQFENYFKQFGTISSYALMKTDSEPPTNKGYGFVAYKEHAEALEALNKTHDQVIDGLSVDGKPLYVQRAQGKQERSRKKEEALRKRRQERSKLVNIYLKHLAPDVTDEKLREVFSPYGEIASVRVMMDNSDPKHPVSRGFGFVCFKDGAEAKRAIDDMNGQDNVLGPKPLYMNLAEPAEARRAKLAMQAMQAQHPIFQQRGMAPMGGMVPPYQTFGGMYQGQPGYPNMMPNRPQFGMGGIPPQNMQRPFPHHQRGIMQPQRGAGGRGGMQPMPGFPGRGRGGMGFAQNQARAPPQGAQAVGAQPQFLDTNLLSSMSDAERRNYLGERLFAAVTEFSRQGAVQQGDVAKVTGMLLELDPTDVVGLLVERDELKAKIDEAVQVLLEDKKGNN